MWSMSLCWWSTRSIDDSHSMSGRLRCLVKFSILQYHTIRWHIQLIQPKLTNRPENAPRTTSHASAPPSGGGLIAGVAGAGPAATDFSDGCASAAGSVFPGPWIPFSGSSFPWTLMAGVELSDGGMFVVALSMDGVVAVIIRKALWVLYNRLGTRIYNWSQSVLNNGIRTDVWAIKVDL